MASEPIPEDLKDTLEMVQSGTVHIGGKYAVQLIERIARLEQREKELVEALEICWFNDDDLTPLDKWIEQLLIEARAKIEARAALKGSE